MLKTRLGRVGTDTGSGLPNPFADTAIGIMVEAVHAAWTHSLILHVAVPTLPDGSGTIVNRIQPTGVLTLEEQFVGDITHTVLGERLHQYAGPQESGLQAVAVLAEITAQAGYHRLLGSTAYQLKLQREEGGCLHSVQYLRLEGSVRIQELCLQVVPGLTHHCLVLLHVTSGSGSHVTHHTGIHHPVAGTQVVPVADSIWQRSVCIEGATAATLQRLIAQPVGPLVVAVLVLQGIMVVLGLIHMVHELLHRLPALIYDLSVAKLLPYRPGYDNTGIGPPHTHHIMGMCAILRKGSHAGIAALVVLGVTHIMQPFMEEGICIGKEGSGLGKYLCIGRPAQTLVALRAVSGYTQVVGALAPQGIGNQFVHQIVACCHLSDFHLLGDGCHRYTPDTLEGDIIIHGSVSEGVTVKATRSVTIEGVFHGDALEAGEDIVVKGGILGSNSTKITCGGDLLADFMEYADVEATGNVSANYILDSTIVSKGQVLAVGEKGSIVGGEVYGMRGVEARYIGNDVFLKTLVSAGVKENIVQMRKDLSRKEKELSEAFQQMRIRSDELERRVRLGTADEAMMTERQSLMREKIEKKAELQEMEQKTREFDELMRISEGAVIRAFDTVYEGVIIMIDSQQFAVEKNKRGVEFSRNEAGALLPVPISSSFIRK